MSFTGTYSPVDIAGEDRSILFLGASNTLYYPNAAMTINACRAYFQLNGITAGDTSPNPSEGGEHVREFKLNFGDEESQGITTTDFTDYTDSDGAWFDMQGRKLDGKPTKAGLYINNGVKVVIK